MGVPAPNKRKYDEDEDEYGGSDDQSTSLKRIRLDDSMYATIENALTDRKRYTVYNEPLTVARPGRVKEILIPKSPFRVVREVDGAFVYCDISRSERRVATQRDEDYEVEQDEDESLVFGVTEHNVFSKLVAACTQESKENCRTPLAFDGSKILIDGFAYDQYSKISTVDRLLRLGDPDVLALLKRAKVCDAVGDGFGSFPLFLPVNACRTAPMTRSLGVYDTYERYGFSIPSRNDTRRTNGLFGVSELKSGNELVDWLLQPRIKWSAQALLTPGNGFFFGFDMDSGLAPYQDYADLSAWRKGGSPGSTLSMLFRCDDELDMEIESSRISENAMCVPSWTDVSLRYSSGDLVSGKFALTSEALKTLDEPRRLWDVCYANGRFVGPIMKPLFDIGFFGIDDNPFAQAAPEQYRKYSLSALSSLSDNPNNVFRHTLLRRASGGVQTLDKGGDFLDVALPFVAYAEYAKCIPEDIDVSAQTFEQFGSTGVEVAEKLDSSLSETLVRQNYFSGKIHDVQRRVDAFSKKFGTPMRDREGVGYYESSLLYEVKSPLALNQHSVEWTEMASYLGNDLKMPVTLNSIPLYNYEYTCGPDSWLASLHSTLAMGADMASSARVKKHATDHRLSEGGKIESELTIRVDETLKTLFRRFSELLERFYAKYQHEPNLSVGAASVAHTVDQWSVLEKVSLVTMLKWTIERHADAIFSPDGARGDDATMQFLSEKMKAQTMSSLPPAAQLSAQSTRVAWMVGECVKSFERTGKWDRRYAEYVACLEVYESVVAPCLDDVSHYSANLVSGKNKAQNKVYGNVTIVKNPDQRAEDFLRRKIAKAGSLTYGRMVSMEPLRRHWLGDAMTVGVEYEDSSERVLQALSDLYLNAKTLFQYSDCHKPTNTAEKGIYELLILFEETLGFDPRDVDVDFDRVDRTCWNAQLMNEISRLRFKFDHFKRFEHNIAQKGETAHYARVFADRDNDDDDEDVPDFNRVAFLSEYDHNMKYYDFSGRVQMDARAARYESVPLWFFGLNLNNAYSAVDVMSNYCNLLAATSAMRFDGRVNAKTMGLPEEFWGTVDEKLSACQNVYAVSSNKNATATAPPARPKPSFPAAMLSGKNNNNKANEAKDQSPYVDGAVSGCESLLHRSMSEAANEVRLRGIPKYAEQPSDVVVDEDAAAAIENDNLMYVSTKLENRSKAGAKNVDFRRIADIDAESLLHVRDLMRYHAYDAMFLAVYASKINSCGIHQTNKMDWNTGNCCVGNLTSVPYGPNYRNVEDFSFWQFGRPFRNKPSFVSNLLNVTSGTNEAKYKRNALRASIFSKTCATSLTALRNFVMSKDVLMDTRTSVSGIPYNKGVHDAVTRENDAKDYKDFLTSLEVVLTDKLAEHNTLHAMDGASNDDISYSALLLSDGEVAKLARLFDRGGVWKDDSDDIAYGAGEITLLDFLNKVKNETRLKQGCKNVLKLWESDPASLKDIAGGEAFATQLATFVRELDAFSEAHLSDPIKKFSKFGVVSYAPVNCWDALYNDGVLREFESLTPEGFDFFVDAVTEAATQISSERNVVKKRQLEASLLRSLGELRSEMVANSGGLVKFYHLVKLSEFYVEGMRRGIIIARLFGKGTMPLSFYSVFYDSDSASVHAMYGKNVPPYFLDAAIYPFYVTGAYSSCKLQKMAHFAADSDIFCGGKDSPLPPQLRCDPYKAFTFDTMGIHDSGKSFKFPNGVKTLSANQLSWGLTASHLFLGDSFSLEFGLEGLNCLSLGSICVVSLNLEKIADYYADGSLTQEIYATLVECKNMFLNVARRTSSYSCLKADNWNEFERSVFCACETYDRIISYMDDEVLSHMAQESFSSERHTDLTVKSYYSHRIKDTGCKNSVPQLVLETYDHELSELLGDSAYEASKNNANYTLTPELWTLVVLYKTFFEVKKYVPTGFVINDSSRHFVSEFSLPSWYSSNADDLLRPVSGRFDLERAMDGLRCTSESRADGVPAMFENDSTNRGRWYFYDDLSDTYNEQSRNIAQNFDHASKKWLGMDEKDLDFEKVPATLAYASNPSSWIHALNTNVHVKRDTPSSSNTNNATGIQRMYSVMVLDCRDDIARKEQVLLDAGYTTVHGDDEANAKKYEDYMKKTKESLQRWEKRVDNIFQELDSKKADSGSKVSRLPLLMRRAQGVEEVKPLQKYLVFTEGSQIRLNTVHYVLQK